MKNLRVQRIYHGKPDYAKDYTGELTQITKISKCKSGKYLIAFSIKNNDGIHHIVMFRKDVNTFINFLKHHQYLHVFADPNPKYNNNTGFYISSAKSWGSDNSNDDKSTDSNQTNHPDSKIDHDLFFTPDKADKATNPMADNKSTHTSNNDPFSSGPIHLNDSDVPF